MKQNQKILITLAVCLTALISCKKSPSSTTAPSSANNSYFPLTTGSTWLYTWGNNSNDNITATGNTYTWAGLTYQELKDVNSNGQTFRYIRNDNGTYYEAVLGNSGAAPTITKILEENGFGDSWVTDSVEEGPGYWVETTYSIEPKGTSVLVQGKQYDNAIHVTLDGMDKNYRNFYYDYYYVKGVGLVEENIDYNTNSSEQLVNCNIK